MDEAIRQYQDTEEWKQIRRGNDTIPSSEDSSAKSKSPDQSSETSLPNGKAAAQVKETSRDPYDIDLNIEGFDLPALEGNFDDILTMDDASGGDWMIVDGKMSPWEEVNKPQENQPTSNEEAQKQKTLEFYGLSGRALDQQEQEFAQLMTEPMEFPDEDPMGKMMMQMEGGMDDIDFDNFLAD